MAVFVFTAIFGCAATAAKQNKPRRTKIRIGLYGSNGHQLQAALANHPRAELVATGAFETLTEEDLDAIIATAKKTGMQFHDQAGTALSQPYIQMRKVVADGTIGEVVQIFAQKSYPYMDRRPQDEDVDGGLLMQAGIHAMRFVEHVGGVKVKSIEAVETKLGNPKPGELRMAAAMQMTLENGGVATIIANYLNSPKFGRWGNEHLRIFGTKGFVEAVDGGVKTRPVLNTEDKGKLPRPEKSINYFDAFLKNLQNGTPMPFTTEEELHPTRMVIRAKKSAMSRQK